MGILIVSAALMLPSIWGYYADAGSAILGNAKALFEGFR